MFVGRKYYLDSLDALWRKNTSSLVVISGRRRIGKSTLVETFAASSKCRFIEIEGLAPDATMNNQKQLAHFCERLAKAAGVPEPRVDGWAKAFDALDSALGHSTGRTVVFLDEISWMGGYDTSFAAHLKNAWDTQFSRRPRLLFVLAGSVSSWIQYNILNSKAFVGRVSLDITLPELSLAECRQFWGAKADRVALREILDVLSVTGGIPKYLQEMDPSLSAAENIRQLCFRPEGYLFKDFDSIFNDIFGKATVKRQLLAALAEGPATAAELSSRLGSSGNGHLSDHLRDLTAAGFIVPGTGRNPETGAPVRAVPYRLRDNYTRFYLKFVEPKAAAIREGLFRFLALEQLPGWDTTMGLQFENLVINNLKVLCSMIGLEGRLVTSAAPYQRLATAKNRGVQIDLLIQTPKSVYLIEINRREYISTTIEQEMQEKVERLSLKRGTSIRTVLVYDGTLSPEIIEDGYFDYLIPAERFF